MKRNNIEGWAQSNFMGLRSQYEGSLAEFCSYP